MERREEIILTALRLAAKSGLSSVSLGQIADGIGIKKASLYNHFASKEELISEMYEYLREQARKSAAIADVDFGELIKGRTAKEILLGGVMNYVKMTKDENLFLFYQLIYQERSIRKEAAQIVMEETKRMISSVKNLFYALQVHGVMDFGNADAAAVAYAMAVHSLVDYHYDSLQTDGAGKMDVIEEYVDWFCSRFQTQNQKGN